MLLMLTFKQIVTSDKEVMFLCVFVCAFVKQGNSKTYRWSLMKFFRIFLEKVKGRNG